MVIIYSQSIRALCEPINRAVPVPALRAEVAAQA